MAKKVTAWKTKGMNQDLSVSAFNPEFAFENMNLRLCTTENNTLMSWVNEKGTEPITLSDNAKILGTPVGTAVLNQYLVIFTHYEQINNSTNPATISNKKDYIYRLEFNKNASTPTMSVNELYCTDLGFSIDHPLETLVSYEAEHIQKVYWVDGINQPRVINIVDDALLSKWYDVSNPPPSTCFDFVSSFSGGNISVEKNSSGGMFAPGVIQYCFCYFNKYGQQSNIVDISPLYYLSHADRGASPEDKVSNSFKLTLSSLDSNFQYVRIYSIQRTSLDLEPFVKLLNDIPLSEAISSSLTFVDTGTIGSAVDPTELLYVGGKEITALTMADKDGTLFFGNIREKNAGVDDIQTYFDEHPAKITFNFTKGPEKSFPLPSDNSVYPYSNFLNDNSSKDITTFKRGEWYRFGFQLQKKTGEWTEPIFIKDDKNEYYPSVDSNNIKLAYATATIDFSNSGIDTNVYQRIRPLVVYPNMSERRVLCQGVLNPTVFNVEDRKTNSPFAQASWYFRPYHSGGEGSGSLINTSTYTIVSTGEVSDWDAFVANASISVEIQEVHVLVGTLKGSIKDEVLKRGTLQTYEVREDASNNGYYYYKFIGVIPLESSGSNINKYAFLRETPWPKEMLSTVHIDENIMIPESGPTMDRPITDKEVSLQYQDFVINNNNEKQIENAADRSFPFPLKCVVKTSNHHISNISGSNFDFRFYTLNNIYRITIANLSSDGTTSVNTEGSKLKFNHYDSLLCQNQLDTDKGNIFNIAKEVEIQGSYAIYDTVIDSNGSSTITNDNFSGARRYFGKNSNAQSNKEVSNTQFFVDQSIVTLNSPDIEFDTDVQNYATEGLKLRIVGAVPITASASAHSITTASGMLGMISKSKTNDNTKSGTLQDASNSASVGGDLGTSNITNATDDTFVSAFPSGSRSPFMTTDPFTERANEYKNAVNNNGTFTGSGDAFTQQVENYKRAVEAGRFSGSKDTQNNTTFGTGEYSMSVIHYNGDPNAGKRLVADYLWNDALIKGLSKDKDTGETNVEVDDWAYDYLIHPWQRTGSLNNDFRSADVASSILKTKKESNLLYSNNTVYSNFKPSSTQYGVFEDIDAEMILTENSYVHNVRLQKQSSGLPSDINYYPNIDKVLYNSTSYKPIIKFADSIIYNQMTDISSPISMKYKSTSHAVISLCGNVQSNINVIPILPGKGSEYQSWISYGTSGNPFWDSTNNWGFKRETLSVNVTGDFLWLGELYRDDNNTSHFALPEKSVQNKWVIGGAEVSLSGSTVSLKWTYGDTYYQRYDCLKTYAFTPEDTNQIVEILSFMCETHVNIDGRYDKNRGQIDNTNMSPVNFNLLNPVYSQKDNFFTYNKIGNNENNTYRYPNLVAYSKTKNSGEDVDQWTNVSLGSILELDGDKGEINSLQRFNNQLIAFQDSGISQILYNENTALSTTNGVPVEIANSGKVQGKRYISNTIGCSNKWSIVNAPSGIYFMDSNNKGIYLFNGEVNNLSLKAGFDVWTHKNIHSQEYKWEPGSFKGNKAFVGYYDKKNQDILFINQSSALAFSEKIGAFTSFYSYGGSPYFCNLEDNGIWIRVNANSSGATTSYGCTLWQHQAGDYCRFFGNDMPYWMTLVGNSEPQMDKTFTNLEFRACVDGERYKEILVDEETDEPIETGKWLTHLPFDSLETWNEYQHGIADLDIRNGHDLSKHHLFDSDAASLIRKFRMWRCDIPRDNCLLDDAHASYDNSHAVDLPYAYDREYNISRFARNPNDRMRNPWIYLKLMKKAGKEDEEAYLDEDTIIIKHSLPRAEIHDVLMTYFE